MECKPGSCSAGCESVWSVNLVAVAQVVSVWSGNLVAVVQVVSLYGV